MTLERIENLISHVLRLGVIVSLGVIVAGTVVSFVHHPGFFWSHTDLGPLISPGGVLPPTVHGILTGVVAGRGQALVMLGLMFLIATPVMRVGVSVIVFLVQRDWIFVAITLVVFSALLFSFWIGRAE